MFDPMPRRSALTSQLVLCCLIGLACSGAEPASSEELERPAMESEAPAVEPVPSTLSAEPVPALLPSEPPDDGAPILAAPGSEGRAPVNQILFRLADGATDRAEAERIARSVGGELVAFAAGLYMIRVPTETMEALGERMERVESDPAVESAMHNWVADLY